MGLQMELLAPSPSLKLMARLLVEDSARQMALFLVTPQAFLFSLVLRQWTGIGCT